jgi:hypothetical protein
MGEMPRFGLLTKGGGCEARPEGRFVALALVRVPASTDFAMTVPTW